MIKAKSQFVKETFMPWKSNSRLQVSDVEEAQRIALAESGPYDTYIK